MGGGGGGGFVVGVRGVVEYFFVVVFVWFGIREEGANGRHGGFKFREKVDYANNEGGLMHGCNLEDALDEGFDALDGGVGFKGAEEEVEVESLFRGGDEAGVKEGLVESSVETVGDGLGLLASCLMKRD